MRTWESALDLIFLALDFIVGAITIPLRVILKDVPGISLNPKLVHGDFFGSLILYDKADSWGIWFWVMLLGLVVAFM
jgi:hypothetical protein